MNHPHVNYTILSELCSFAEGADDLEDLTSAELNERLENQGIDPSEVSLEIACRLEAFRQTPVSNNFQMEFNYSEDQVFERKSDETTEGKGSCCSPS